MRGSQGEIARIISIHAPPRGATAPNGQAQAPVRHFNSRPSARGDQRGSVLRAGHLDISIHAPPRGATRSVRAPFSITIFQFTPLREGRLHPAFRKRADGDISIHAPPRGATHDEQPPRAATTFQFTPLREGRRSVQLGGQLPRRHFNSRPSARGDAAARNCPDLPAGFQFTPLREGRLVLQPPCALVIDISIHAPPRGATSLRTSG